MKFSIQKEENITSLIRKLGYVPGTTTNNEFSCLRYLSRGDYPRFHLYIRQEKDKFFFNLHLDQKKPSYKGSSAHAGEYDGELVEKEKERILKSLS